MTQFKDLFNPEIIFSKKNPFLKATEKTHRLVFESFDRAARLQLGFAGDLLDLNRKRIDALYAGDTLLEKVSAQQELATEIGKRAVTWVGDLQEIAVDLRSDIGNAANDLVFPVAAKAPATKAKKAKAA
jgi:hypothetical protein